MAETIYGLEVLVSISDRLSRPLKGIATNLEYTGKQAKLMQQAMRSVGAGGELQALQKQMDALSKADAFGQLSKDMARAGASTAQIQKVADGINKVAKAQERLQTFQKTAITGGVMIGLGAAGVDMIAKGIKMSGEFTSQLVTIQDTTGATTKQMQALGNTIMATSAQVSRFNDMQVGEFAQQLASGGVGGIANVQKLLPAVSKFADAQLYEGKSSDGSASVNMAINMAHLLGHYDPNSLLKSLDTFNKYSVMEPGSSQDLYQTLKYLVPKGRSLHMDETSMMQMAALANRVGLTGSHGGKRFAPRSRKIAA